MYGTPGKFNEIKELAQRIVIKAEWAAKDADTFDEATYWERIDEFIDETRMLAQELGCEIDDPRKVEA